VTKPATTPAKVATPSKVGAPAKTAASSSARAANKPVAAAPAKAAVPAAEKTGPGSLAVDSRPTGANVFLDGKLIGTTPMVLETVSAGEHAIRLDADGYRRWATSVRVASGERNRVAASLER
jgi:hypothetical protein